MPRTMQPHSPDVELAAHSIEAAEASSDTVLTPGIVDFCQSGISVIIAVGRAEAAPVAGTGCGCRVLENGRVRLLLPHRGNEALVLAAERGGQVAATFSQPITHRSIQIKGGKTCVVETSTSDRDAAIQQMAGLRLELREIEHSAQFSEAYCHVDTDDLASIEFEPDAAFVQTPGPGAGAQLKA